MRHFLKVFDGIDTFPALLQLHEHPELWDEFTPRTCFEESPHYGLSDVWLRYRDRAELSTGESYVEPHFPVWWPAWHVLTEMHPIVFAVAARCKATQIGGCFVTRIPPGGQVKPHDDAVSWHARFHPCKVYIPLATNGRCINRCEDEEAVFGVGQAWIFNNLVTHSVENNGDTERVTLIVCMRRD